MTYLIRLSDRLDIDLVRAVERKLVISRKKYPAELVRGRSQKYSEYKIWNAFILRKIWQMPIFCAATWENMEFKGMSSMNSRMAQLGSSHLPIRGPKFGLNMIEMRRVRLTLFKNIAQTRAIWAISAAHIVSSRIQPILNFAGIALRNCLKIHNAILFFSHRPKFLELEEAKKTLRVAEAILLETSLLDHNPRCLWRQRRLHLLVPWGPQAIFRQIMGNSSSHLQ